MASYKPRLHARPPPSHVPMSCLESIHCTNVLCVRIANSIVRACAFVCTVRVQVRTTHARARPL